MSPYRHSRAITIDAACTKVGSETCSFVSKPFVINNLKVPLRTILIRHILSSGKTLPVSVK
jgi:hypothetical protein